MLSKSVHEISCHAICKLLDTGLLTEVIHESVILEQILAALLAEAHEPRRIGLLNRKHNGTWLLVRAANLVLQGPLLRFPNDSLSRFRRGCNGKVTFLIVADMHLELSGGLDGPGGDDSEGVALNPELNYRLAVSVDGSENVVARVAVVELHRPCDAFSAVQYVYHVGQIAPDDGPPAEMSA